MINDTSRHWAGKTYVHLALEHVLTIKHPVLIRCLIVNMFHTCSRATTLLTEILKCI